MQIIGIVLFKYYTAQEIYGYLPLKLQRFIAEKLGVPLSKIYGVTTFYSFSTKPRGKYTIRICLGTACYIKGAKQILNKLREVLGIDVGETTEDGKFTLEVMRCVGACGLSPVITINGKVYKRVDCLNIEDILKEYINQ